MSAAVFFLLQMDSIAIELGSAEDIRNSDSHNKDINNKDNNNNNNNNYNNPPTHLASSVWDHTNQENSPNLARKRTRQQRQ